MSAAPRLFASSLLVACAALGIGCTGLRITTDYDPAADFSGFKRYAWLPRQPVERGDPRLHNDLLDARVRNAVDRTLSGRGFEKAPEASADFFVSYHLSLETRIDVQTVHHSHRYSRRGWSGSVGTSTHVREYELGTLLLDVLAPGDRRLVWRGSGQARVRETSDPAQREQRINEVVESVLKRFPPQ